MGRDLPASTRVLAGLNPDRTGASARTSRYFAAHTAGENLITIIGSQRTTRNAIPMIWMFPGLNTALLARQEPRYTDLVAIAAMGYPVIVGDWGTLPGGNWGDDTELASIESGISWANTNLGTRTDQIILGGESKGALGVLNVAWRNPRRVAAMWIRGPVTALQAFHDRGLFATDVEASYGGLSGLVAAYPTHDPSHANNIPKIAAGLGRLLRIDADRADELIPGSEVASYAAAVGCREVHWHDGGHANIFDTPTTAVTDWIDRTVRFPGYGGQRAER